MKVNPNHPKQKLVFYISDDIEDERDVFGMHEAVTSLSRSLKWVIGPPVFLNETQDDPEAGEWRTVGGFIELFSALPPWGAALSPEVDRAHFEEVKATIDALTAFSKQTGHEIAFELDGAQIGWIEKGIVDNSLREGLLGEWERTFAG